MARSLYLCYFPLHEPLVQTQVLPYLRAIAATGVEVCLLTFEPESPASAEATTARLAGEGIEWHHRRYHKRPTLPATLFDIAVGAAFVRRRVLAGGIGVLHARSHVPAAMAVLGRARTGDHRPRFLFDVRGFMPEEYVDAGIWPAGGLLFRGMKRAEGALLRRADGIVVLTERARGIVALRTAPATPIEVVPCCVDLAAFPPPTPAAKEAAKRRLGVDGRRVILYMGSTEGFYRFDEMVGFAATAAEEDPSAFFLVLTQRNIEQVAARVAAGGLSPGQFGVRTVAPADVPAHAVAADLALSFIPPTYSKQASSPTKVAEYLACGVPVVATRGVGDIDSQLGEGEDAVGVLIDDLRPGAYRDALRRMAPLLASPETAARCRRAAERLFDLAGVGAPRYARLYEQLLGAGRSARA